MSISHRSYYITVRTLYSHLTLTRNVVSRRYGPLLQDCLDRSLLYPVSSLSTSTHLRNKNFITKFVDSVRQEFAKSKELKESVDKFYKDTKKLDDSEALQQARKKYKEIEQEGSDILGGLKEKMTEVASEAQKSEFVRRGREVGGRVGDIAGKAGERIGAAGKSVAATQPFQVLGKGVTHAVDLMDSDEVMARYRLYRPPTVLRKRRDRASMPDEERREVEENLHAKDVVLHKDSRWYQSWVNFRETNPYVNNYAIDYERIQLGRKVFDLKSQYEESDSLAARMTRGTVDRVSSFFTSVMGSTELSEVLSEIVKMDPDFDREKFIRECQFDIIPNIMEALVRQDIEILQDWCYEAAFNQLSHPINEAKKLGYTFDNKIIDISDVDIPGGKMMEQGPVLLLTFNAQQQFVIKDGAGKIVEGSPDDVMRVRHVWAICRDQTCLDPKAAWKILELQYHSEKQWF